MRKLTLWCLPTLALFCAGCTGVLVISEPQPPPVVIEDDHHDRGKVAQLGIPPGHLPRPGQCRIWHPGRPPGHQPPTGRCSVLERELPADAWLLYRPDHDRKHVIVKVCHATRPAFVIAIRTYEARSGRFVQEERP